MTTPITISKETRFPCIIGQPRMRSDMFSKTGWWFQIGDVGTNDGAWWWPVMCVAHFSIDECLECGSVPEWSTVLADGIERWLNAEAPPANGFDLLLAKLVEKLDDWPTGPCLNCHHQAHGKGCGTQILTSSGYTTCSCTEYFEDLTKRLKRGMVGK